MKWIINIANFPKGHELHNEKEEIQIAIFIGRSLQLSQAETWFCRNPLTLETSLIGKRIWTRNAENSDVELCTKVSTGVREPSRLAAFIPLCLPPFFCYCSLSLPFICHHEKKARYWRWQLWIDSALKIYPSSSLIWSPVYIMRYNNGFMNLTYTSG